MQNNNLSQYFENEINKFLENEKLAKSHLAGNVQYIINKKSNDKTNNMDNSFSSFNIKNINNSKVDGGSFNESSSNRLDFSINLFSGIQKAKTKNNSKILEDENNDNNNRNNVEKKDDEKEDSSYISLQSKNLKATKYEKRNKKLYVQFLNGGEYSYENVPNTTYKSLMENSSHGSYFYWNIRGSGVPYPISPPYAYEMLVAPNHWHKTHNTVKIWNNIIKKRYNNFGNLKK